MKTLEELLQISKEVLSIKQELQLLEEYEVVKRYIELNKRYLIKEKQELLKKKEYIKEVQKNCNHLILFLKESNTDDYEQKNYYTCICLNCNTKVSGRDKDFKDKIVLTGDYIDIFKDYHYTYKNLTFEEKIDKLTEKYGINNENKKIKEKK